MTITALKCGHSILTTSGNVSEHSTGDAVDIAVINGIPVTGHQGPGTLVDELIRDVLALQGTMHPHQVISLEDLPGETSFALPDHYDHVHIGYYPVATEANPLEAEFSALLKPEQWQRLIGRLGEIENPEVPIGPSKYSLPDEEAGRGRHRLQRRPGRRRLDRPGRIPASGQAIRIRAARLRRAAGRWRTGATWLGRSGERGRERPRRADAGRTAAAGAPATAAARGRAGRGALPPAARPRHRGAGLRPVRERGGRRPLARRGDRGRGHGRRPGRRRDRPAQPRPARPRRRRRRPARARADARAGGGGAGRLRQRRRDRRRPLHRGPRGRRLGQRRLAPPPAPGGPAPAGTGRGGARRARAVDACETLLLRARADLDAGRRREAALQLRVGLEALLVELEEARRRSRPRARTW